MEFFLHTLAMAAATVEIRAGAYEEAERILRPAWEGLAAAGETGYRTTVGAMLAGALIHLERFDEARTILDECTGFARPDDMTGIAEIHSTRGLLEARTGNAEAGLEHARLGVEVIDTTDYADQRVEARLALGEVLHLAGRREEAEAVLAEAIAHAQVKGSRVLEETARGLLHIES
jgi:thioredoxin-like negative regulator of GroEL